jgi:hypothetical protein
MDYPIVLQSAFDLHQRPGRVQPHVPVQIQPFGQAWAAPRDIDRRRAERLSAISWKIVRYSKSRSIFNAC